MALNVTASPVPVMLTLPTPEVAAASPNVSGSLLTRCTMLKLTSGAEPVEMSKLVLLLLRTKSPLEVPIAAPRSVNVSP